METLANRFANWGLETGLEQRNTVCLMVLNRPEYVAFWLGMAKIGVSTALLNTNIAGKPFIHSVQVSVEKSPQKIVIIDDELHDTLEEDILYLRSQNIRIIFLRDLLQQVSSCSVTRPSKSHRNQIKESDPVLFVFTSGTTGLPKAAKISNTRFYMMTLPCSEMAYLRPGERVYCALPLYHSAGGILGVGGCLVTGATLVFRKKFSSSQFAADCVRYQCTSMQYIGELCRYMLNTPPSPHDSAMKIKYAFGNGLRAEIWKPFQERFRIGRIVEFYSATEANVALFNSTGKVGALGCVPRILDLLYPVKILRVNPEQKDQPLRTNGRCIPADYDEPGLVVCLVNNKHPISRFDGYTDSEASNKKILKDVFSGGDTYFNSGDLLRRDWFGFFFWCDRVGDTFRWKGENVATTEVEHVLASIPFISDVTVYGVEVANCDGKAGMASIVLKNQSDLAESLIDWSRYHSECQAHLAPYARPVFIRIQNELRTTGTFKHQKNDLIREGYNPEKIISDRLYFYHDNQVVPLTQEVYEMIQIGKIKL